MSNFGGLTIEKCIICGEISLKLRVKCISGKNFPENLSLSCPWEFSIQWANFAAK